MGAWGEGPFENDAAGDWAWQLDGDTDGSVVRAALAVSEADYLDSDDGCSALAAAEVVAAALGRPLDRLPPEVEGWVTNHGDALTESDASAALLAVDRVGGEDSELKDLWEESGPDTWQASLADLRRRLAPPEA